MITGSDKSISTDLCEATILLAGELACQNELKEEKELFGEEKLTYYDCFSLMKPVLDRSDLTIASLSEAYDYPDEFITAVKDVGFDVLTVGARNVEGAGDKIRKQLDEHELTCPEGRMVGTTIVNVKDIKIGIIELSVNYAYGSLVHLSEVMAKVEQMDREKVDLKICYVHWRLFIDPMLDVDERLRVFVKALANMGIDYVVGAGHQYLMRYEIVKGSWNRRMPVAYSLGNLLYCSNQYRKNANTSAIILLNISKDANGRITISDNYLPCYTWTLYKGKRRRVQFLNDRKYKRPNSDILAKRRKQYVAGKLGDGISVCRDFDVNAPSADGETDTAPVAWIADEYARERLNDTGELQSTILDSYRLTEEFRDIYGKMLYSSEKYSPLIKGVELFLSHNYPDFLEREDADDIIADMLYCRYVLSFTYNEYFGFHLYEKSIRERVEYISDMFRLNYYRRMNRAEREKNILDNKWTCYERMPELFRRDIINVEDSSQRDQFKKYAVKYGRFIIKPTNGSLGQGIRIIDMKDYDDLDALFDEVLAKAGPFVCEELIISRKYLSDLHPQSCNSVRVFTYNDDGDVKIVCSWLKAGIGGAIVDNGGAGGVVAAINKDNGMVEYDAANEAGNIYECHPDTGIRFKGIQIEEWDSLIEMAKKAAAYFPTVKFIAWDVAHGEKGWQLIEGNSQGQMWIYQLSSGKGLRKEMEELIGWTNSKRKSK